MGLFSTLFGRSAPARPSPDALAEQAVVVIASLDQLAQEQAASGAWDPLEAELGRQGLIGAVSALAMHRLGLDLARANPGDPDDPIYAGIQRFSEALVAACARHEPQIPDGATLRSLIEKDTYGFSFLERRLTDPPARQRLTFAANVARDLWEHLYGEAPATPDADQPKRQQIAQWVLKAEASLAEVT